MTPMREHRWTIMFGNQQKSLHHALPFFGIVFSLGSLVMCCAASRRVSSGVRPGNTIGSKNS